MGYSSGVSYGYGYGEGSTLFWILFGIAVINLTFGAYSCK